MDAPSADTALSDFLETEDPGIAPEDHGPNMALVGDMKPRHMTRSIMAVYRDLGGDAWLLDQAKENPREFMGMLKHILPRNLDADFIPEIRIMIDARQESQMDLQPNGRVLEHATLPQGVQIL